MVLEETNERKEVREGVHLPAEAARRCCEFFMVKSNPSPPLPHTNVHIFVGSRRNIKSLISQGTHQRTSNQILISVCFSRGSLKCSSLQVLGSQSLDWRLNAYRCRHLLGGISRYAPDSLKILAQRRHVIDFISSLRLHKFL